MLSDRAKRPRASSDHTDNNSPQNEVSNDFNFLNKPPKNVRMEQYNPKAAEIARFTTYKPFKSNSKMWEFCSLYSPSHNREDFIICDICFQKYRFLPNANPSKWEVYPSHILFNHSVNTSHFMQFQRHTGTRMQSGRFFKHFRRMHENKAESASLAEVFNIIISFSFNNSNFQT
jgi:hypothetical protein